MVISEIFETLNAPDDDYTPKGIAANMQKAIQNSPENAEAIRKQLLELPHQKKRLKIIEYFEVLKNYIEGERLIAVAKEINKAMQQKLVVSGGVSAEKVEKRVATEENAAK